VFQAPLKQYSPSGTLVDAVISAEMISDVAWDDVNEVFILLNPLPSTPTGTIMWYTGITAPAGWAICNGNALSAAAQPALFAVLGYTFGGAGDSFSVPNLLGQFIRGFDSSEAVDPGRVFGSTQTGQMESHHHNMWWVNYDGGGGRGLVDPVNPLNITTAGQSTSGYTGWGVDFAGTGTETRPTNVALTPCIKY
jgi:microcystin-dependent protein